MKPKKCPFTLATGLLAATAALLAGCHNVLVFSTSTKVGLDISQRGDQQPEVTFGYNRTELVSIPLGHTNGSSTNFVIGDASATNDAYSVIGAFAVTIDTRITSNTAGVHVNQLFATGLAAQKAAINPVLGRMFGSNFVAVINLATNTTK